jgi:hypothetical protein
MYHVATLPISKRDANILWVGSYFPGFVSRKWRHRLRGAVVGDCIVVEMKMALPDLSSMEHWGQSSEVLSLVRTFVLERHIVEPTRQLCSVSCLSDSWRWLSWDSLSKRRAALRLPILAVCFIEAPHLSGVIPWGSLSYLPALLRLPILVACFLGAPCLSGVLLRLPILSVCSL